MRREYNRACELACDEAVIRTLDNEAKQNYGDTLISVVAESRYPVGVMSVTMWENKKLKERLEAIMNYKKKTKIAVLITAVLAVTLTGCAFAFGAGFSGNNRDLIEMEIIRTPITEYSDSEQIKWGDRTYSPAGEADSLRDTFKAGKHIGIIRDGKYHYDIYECKGVSTERYLVAYYDVMMSTYSLFAAEENFLTLAEVEKVDGQTQMTVRQYLGEPNGTLSGFKGDIYTLANGRQTILFYGNDMRVESIERDANNPQNQITVQPVHYGCYLESVPSSAAVTIGRINLCEGVRYTLTIKAGTGRTLFAALNKAPDISEYTGTEWFQFTGRDDSDTLTAHFDCIEAGIYYFYIGSTGEALTNVDVNLLASVNEQP